MKDGAEGSHAWLKYIGSVKLAPWTLASAGVLAACGSPTGTVCTEVAVAGLNVQVRDSISGLSLAGGSSVTAQDGAYIETLAYFSAADSFFGAVERAGSYTVEVTHPGYKPWERSNVGVAAATCHVIPVQLLVRLQSLP